MPDNESQDEPTYDLVVPFENHRSAPTTPADPVSPPSAPLTAQHRALQRWFADRQRDTEGDWRKEALCAQADPERWFPDKGGNPRPAQAICAICPVREECLADALANNETYGIWGGKTARQRQELAGRRHVSATHCRNGHGYTLENTISTGFGRRCRVCKLAADRVAGRRRDALNRAVSDRNHLSGTTTLGKG